MLKEKISFIGPGVMAEAMIDGLLRQGISSPDLISVSGPDSERLGILKSKYQITAFADNSEAASNSDVVVLAVKPQRLREVMSRLHGLKPDTLLISIIAGASIKTLNQGLKHKLIVRSMPNTPGRIGKGITVWTASNEANLAQQALARIILGAMGQELYVENEEYLDMATALSGTGPAYVFLFAEALIDAGVHLGFPHRIAEQLVIQTIKGSVEFYEQAQSHPASLRNQVTSPGGTSAAALYYLEKAGFRTAISRAVWAAFQRSKELGREKQAQDSGNND